MSDCFDIFFMIGPTEPYPFHLALVPLFLSGLMFLEGFLEVVFLFLDNFTEFFVLFDYFFCNFFVSFESGLLFFCFSPFKLLHMQVVGFLSPKFLLLVLLVRRYNSINDIGVDSE